MTNQQIIDKVYNHFIIKESGFPRDLNGDFACLYKDTNGNKCAVGIFIDESVYTENIEGRIVKALDIVFGTNTDITFLQQLQLNFDHLYWESEEASDAMLREKWEAKLRSIAKTHNLETKHWK